jgi:hypothetical protein
MSPQDTFLLFEKFRLPAIHSLFLGRALYLVVSRAAFLKLSP